MNKVCHYVLGLCIGQNDRYDICINTKWSIFDISDDISGFYWKWMKLHIYKPATDGCGAHSIVWDEQLNWLWVRLYLCRFTA